MKEHIKHLQQTKCPNVTPLLLGTTEVFRPWNVWWFFNDVTVLGIFHAHAWQTYRLKEHSCVTSINNTTISPPLSPHNIHCCNTPPVNILDVLPVDQTPIDMILWDILTHKMPYIPIPHEHNRFHQPIEPATSTKRKGLTSQANKTIIVTLFKFMLYRTNSASYQPG